MKNKLLLIIGLFLIIGSINVFGYWTNTTQINKSSTFYYPSNNSNIIIDNSNNWYNLSIASNMVIKNNSGFTYFDTSNLNFKSNHSKIMMFEANFTISLWFQKNTSISSTQILLGDDYTSGSGTSGFIINLGTLVEDTTHPNSPNSLLFYFAPYNNRKAWVNSSISITDNNWHNAVFTRSGTTLKIYIDGIDRTGTLTTEGSAIDTYNWQDGSYKNFSIGRSNTRAEYFRGNISGINIWNTTTLPLSSIQYINSSGKSFTFDNPISALPINFTIINTNNYDNASISIFSALIDGITYNTTTGTITTPFLTNSTTLKNITIISQNMFNKSYLNQNISSSLAASQNQYPIIYLVNRWDSSNISIASVEIDGLNYSTSSIFIYVPFNSSKIVKTFATDYITLIENKSIFQNTLNLINVSQSIINFSARQIITNDSLSNFTISLNGSVVCIVSGSVCPLVYPNAGIYVATLSPNNGVDFHTSNTTINISVLQNNTFYLYAHDHVLNVTARNILSNVSISNFSVVISSLNRTDVRNYSTIDGSIVIPIIHDVYNLTIDGENFALFNNSKLINVTTGDLNTTFYLFTTNSLEMFFYRYSDGKNMSGTNVTINFIGSTAQQNITDTGRLYVDLFTPDSYTILYSAVGFRQGKYLIDLTNKSYNRLDLYFENETGSSLILIVVKDKFGKPLSNVEVLIQKWYNDGWVTDQIVKTDFQGRAEAYYVLSTTYYNHVLTYNGQIYFGSINNNANKKVIYAEDVVNGLNFNIDILGNSILPAYQVTQKVVSNLTFVNLTNSSGYFRYFWSDPDNLQREGCLEIVNLSSNLVIYSNCLTTATGTIVSDVINVSSNPTFFRAMGTLEDFLNKNLLVRIGINPAGQRLNWGVTGYIVALLCLVIAYFGFIYSPTISLIVGFIVFALLAIFGVIFGNMSGKDYGALLVLAVITYLIARIPSNSGVNR